MAIEFTDKPCVFCPDNCPYMHVEVAIEVLYADGEPYQTRNCLTCVHEDICGLWANKIKSQNSLSPVCPNETAFWYARSPMNGNTAKQMTAFCSKCGHAEQHIVDDSLLPKICPNCCRQMTESKKI